MRGFANITQALLAKCCWAFMLTALQLLSAVAVAEPHDLKEAVLEIAINEQAGGETLVVLRDENNGLWLEESDFKRLRLKLPKVIPYQYEQRHYFPLTAISGVAIDIDEAHQRANIQAPAEAFITTQFAAHENGKPMLTPAATGAFFNYQLSTQRIADATLSGAFNELGIFTEHGVFTNTSVVRSQSGDTQWIRIDSAFTHDFPDRIERLVVGDTISDAGSWGSAVRFGGISWGKDFSIRPDLVTTPLLTAGGTAVVPSTVDVFINNQKVASQTLPPGPFIIDRLPAVTGSGDISLVVRDALGREQVLTQPFYSSLSLLAPGLSQYQMNLGRIRNDYALSSNDYGNWLSAATYRRGLTSALTLEVHGEMLQHDAHSLGMSMAMGLSRYGVLNVLAATGGDANNSGSLLGMGIESRGSIFNFNLNTKIASSGYRQVANAGIGYQQFKERDLAQSSLNLQRVGSFAVAFARESYFNLPMQRVLSLTYSTNIGNWASISFVASHTYAQQSNNSFFLTFTVPMSKRRAASLSANGGNGVGAPPNEVYATLSQSPPVGPGYGYRVSASTAQNYNADGRWQTHAGDLDAQLARDYGVSGQSLFWSGAATLLDGEVRASRVVTDSFALVDVAGIADVPVYIDHQLITHTDNQGRALLHDLLPYQPNRINIEPTELPLDTNIETRTLVLAPGYRSGVIARFPVTRVHSATFRLVTEDNAPVPLGSQVRFNGKVFPVAYDGVTYVTGYDHGMAGQVSWDGGSCEFRVAPPASNDPLPDLGKIECRKTAQNKSLSP